MNDWWMWISLLKRAFLSAVIIEVPTVLKKSTHLPIWLCFIGWFQVSYPKNHACIRHLWFWKSRSYLGLSNNGDTVLTHHAWRVPYFQTDLLSYCCLCMLMYNMISQVPHDTISQCTYTYIYTHIHTCIHVYLYIYIYIHIYTHIHIHIYIYTYTYPYVYIYTHICIYIIKDI